MENQVVFIVVMGFIISLLTQLANKLRIAYPVLLVLAGLFLSFISGMPDINMDPALIFYIFLPPLLFQSSYAISLKEMWQWKRVILSFAFLVVLLTAVGVGLIASWIIPGMTLAMGMVLGGIVSSTDAVSATTIMQQVKVPSRIATILEGESLLNDASSLIVFSFALLAVQTGHFEIQHALLSFIWMVVGGAIIGIVIGIGFVYLHKVFPAETNVTIVFTLIAPFLMYIAGESASASGVLSVVFGGFYMGQHTKDLDSKARLLGSSVWSNTAFVLNGYAFLLIGLNLREIVNAFESDGIGIMEATLYALFITLIIMTLRILNAYLAIPISKWRRKELGINQKMIIDSPTSFIVGWCGMRGVVSLAAALSIPFTLPGGEALPHRSIILYCTFIVILTTLLLQGLTLPLLLKWIHFPKYHDNLDTNEASIVIRKGLAECGLRYLQDHPSDTENDVVLHNIVEHWQALAEECATESLLNSAGQTYHKILEAQRNYLYQLNRERPDIDKELIRHFIRRIDLEEELIRND
ncbi:MAG: Na+/H+ antiporter [Bacteroidaceae bacterium]|nr:Na+/H+ antiporter [Bacteroidaceae bacterium]